MNHFLSQKDPRIRIVEEADGTYLEMEAEKELFEIKTEIIGTEKLGMVRIVEAPYEDPKGDPIVLNTDYLGLPRKTSPMVGSLENLKEGYNQIKVWGR